MLENINYVVPGLVSCKVGISPAAMSSFIAVEELRFY